MRIHGAEPLRPRPGRPRDAEADRAIIAATLELIAEGGYADLRVADVAARAGVSKATMYRRWPTKVHLVMAALQTTPPLRGLDTGDLRQDLIGLLAEFLGIVGSTPLANLLPALAAERARDPSLAALFDPFVNDRRRPFLQALQRAVARHEIPPDTDLDVAASAVVGPMLSRILMGQTTDRKTLRRCVDYALRGLVRGRV